MYVCYAYVFCVHNYVDTCMYTEAHAYICEEPRLIWRNFYVYPPYSLRVSQLILEPMHMD